MKLSEQCAACAHLLEASGSTLSNVRPGINETTLRCQWLAISNGILASPGDSKTAALMMAAPLVKMLQACKTNKAGVKPSVKPLHRRVKPVKPNGIYIKSKILFTFI